MAIENAMRKKDYDCVIKLTLDGEEKDKDKRGLVNQWKEYRYKAFQLSGKLDEQRGIAMEFILDGNFEYYKELNEFKEEVYTLFMQYIEQTAIRASNRKDYQRVCAIIRNLKKAGGKEQALEIRQKLFNKYANRPAFRDELSRV